MANKKNYNYKKNTPSSHNKATRITVLVLAFLMVAGILATMVGYIIYAIIGDDHDGHDHGSSSVVSSTVTSNGSTADSKPTSSKPAGSTADSKPASTTDTSK